MTLLSRSFSGHRGGFYLSLLLLLCNFPQRTSANLANRKRRPVQEPEIRECEISGDCPLYPEPECGVYMAPSTVGNHSNNGMYTGFPLRKGDVVNFPEIVIPLMFRMHFAVDALDGRLWDRYIWEGKTVNMENPSSDYDTNNNQAAFIPGIGCTVNSMLHLHNIHSTHGSVYDTAGLHRSKDPGSGAFTPYHSSKTTISADQVEAGEELFASYGDHWIPWIPGAAVTFNDNMDDADDFLKEYTDWVEEHDIPAEVAEGLWNLTASKFPYLKQTKIFGVLPKAEKWEAVHKAVNDHRDDDTSVVRKFLREGSRRKIEWLKKHGKCQDHIKPGRSTISQAGRGAFATRNLPEGTVVGYSPLVHIGNRREMLNVTYDQDPNHVYSLEDLVINYSFGHKDSTMLLTPYGGMVNFINHDKEKANVKVQWPEKEMIAHKPEWLEKDVDFFVNTREKIGLSFDYVALRNIKQGEEIFLDYGDEWQAAWDKHVETWRPPPNAKDYVHATEWKEYFLTAEELETRPYPPTLYTRCIPSYTLVDGTYLYTKPVQITNRRVPCHVLKRTVLSDESAIYTVNMTVGDGTIVVEAVPPEEGIELKNRANTTDFHLEGAFRHEIMIPDDIFPENWKNKK